MGCDSSDKRQVSQPQSFYLHVNQIVSDNSLQMTIKIGFILGKVFPLNSLGLIIGVDTSTTTSAISGKHFQNQVRAQFIMILAAIASL